jgi:metacaspase-1
MTIKALLVGINEYRSVRGLRGCVNDVVNIRSVLKQVVGLNNEDIRVVIDDRATKAMIRDRLQWLTAGTKAGDVRIFHFSGHGSQIRDRENDELGDGLDEILCPHDMDWDGTFITDDDLDELLQVPDGVLLEAVLDCCHSGDSARALGLEAGEASPGGRFLRPPIDIASRHEGDNLRAPRKLLARRPATLWSACDESQTAADASMGGIFNGAFTFFLCKHLRENVAGTREELLARVTASLVDQGFEQRPQLRSAFKPRRFLEMGSIPT